MRRRRTPKPSRPSARRYPTPKEREHIVQRRDKLLEELVTLLVATPPTKQDAAIARLAQTYGVAEVALGLERFAKMAHRTLVGEEPGLYREYRLIFARFGGERRFLSKREYEELIFEHGTLAAKRKFKSLFRRGPSKREQALCHLLLIDERSWEDLFPPSPPPRPPVFTTPPAGSYPTPLKDLLNLGWQADEETIAAMARKPIPWKRFIPDLERMVLDEGLLSGWPADPSSWAPLHALRLLGHLRAHQSAGRLLALMDREDDWLSDLLPSVWAEMGPQAAEPLWDYMVDRRHSPEQRGNVMVGLQRLAEQHPHYRHEVVEGLAQFLDDALAEDSTANAYAVYVLAELRAVEALSALHRAYEAGKVDLTVMGWGDVISRMGWEEGQAGVPLPTELLPEEERLDGLMQAGYRLLEVDQVTAACDQWLEAWELVKQMAAPEMRTVSDFDDAHPGLLQFVFNWSYDLEMELHNAGLHDPVYHEHRLRYTREFLNQFPDEEADRYVGFIRAQGEALWNLGRRDEAEAAYADLVERFPDKGWAYIGWADHLWLYRNSPKEYEKGEAILKRALARPNLQDRADVLDRLADLYAEWNRPEDQAVTEAEPEQAQARSRSWRRLLPELSGSKPPAEVSPPAQPPERKTKKKRKKRKKQKKRQKRRRR